MKNTLLFFCFLITTNVLAQNFNGRYVDIAWYNEANRSWTYNHNRFSRLLWTGIKNGELSLYVYDTKELPRKTSLSDLYSIYYYSINQTKLTDYANGRLSQADSMDVLNIRSMSILSSAEAKADSPAWLSLFCDRMEGDFGYSLSYSEALQWLDKQNSYWVNPYDVTDSIRFSDALRQERFVYDVIEQNEFKSSEEGQRYCNVLRQDKQFVFNGKVTRFALLEDKANMPLRAANMDMRTILISAYMKGEIIGYHPVTNQKISPKDFIKISCETSRGIQDYVDEDGQVAFVTYDYPCDTELDLFGVRFAALATNNSYEEKPEEIVLGVSEGQIFAGRFSPLISFPYEDAIALLNASGKWYSEANNADSCGLGDAIKSNKICWKYIEFNDADNVPVYDMAYNEDSLKVFLDEDSASCGVSHLIKVSSSVLMKQMNVEYHGKPYPAAPNLPLYFRYKMDRVLDQKIDSSLTFLRDLPVYLMNKALKGELTMYRSDSLTTKLSKTELAERMMNNYVEYYDEAGNPVGIVDTLDISELSVACVSSDVMVNKDKVTFVDRSLYLQIPLELSSKGIQWPVVYFSYAELTLIMKKSKEGKVLLKKLNATVKKPFYDWVRDIYGREVYVYSQDEEYKRANLDAINRALLPYLKK